MRTNFQALCLLLVILCLPMVVRAQLKIGIRGGISTYSEDVNPLDIFVPGGGQQFELDLKNAPLGIHAGLVFNIKMGKFYLQPEVLFNSNTVEYELDGFMLSQAVFEEKYQYLDIPLMLGYRLGPLRLNGGPVGHVFIDSVTDLVDFGNYDRTFENLTLGWQAGLGLDVWKIGLDVRYEGNFTANGGTFRFFGEEYEFDNTLSRWLFALTWMF